MPVDCKWCDDPIHEGSPYVKVTLSRIDNGLRTTKELAYYHINCGSMAIKSPTTEAPPLASSTDVPKDL